MTPEWQISSHRLLPLAAGHELPVTNRCPVALEQDCWRSSVEHDSIAAGCMRVTEVDSLVEVGAGTGTGKAVEHQGLAGAYTVHRVENNYVATEREEAQP